MPETGTVIHIQRQVRQAIRRHRAVRLSFIDTELDLALTFCETAIGARSTSRALRNIQQALDAYHSALHFLAVMDSQDGAGSDREQIDTKIDRLRSCLRQLGQEV